MLNAYDVLEYELIEYHKRGGAPMIKTERCILGSLVLLFFAFCPSAFSDTILTLNQEPAHTIGPQSTSAPCIIAGTTCQNPAGFDYNNFTQGGNITAFDENSPVYEISQFPFLTFNVAIDVNTANDGEILDLFEVFVDGTRIYHYDGPGAIGLVSSNGNGYGDWTLRSVDLSSFDPDQEVLFHAVWHDASDGAESFFIVSTTAPPCTGPECEPTPVPEPSSLILLGLGLASLGLYAKRGKK